MLKYASFLLKIQEKIGPTFTHKSLSYKSPQHICAMMTVCWLVKSLFHEKMPVASVIKVRVCACRASTSVHSLLSTHRHLGSRFRGRVLTAAFHGDTCLLAPNLAARLYRKRSLVYVEDVLNLSHFPYSFLSDSLHGCRKSLIRYC
jgi:hypothetical protein